MSKCAFSKSAFIETVFLIPIAEFVDPWLGDKVNSGKGLSYWPTSHVAWQAGTTAPCLSWLSPPVRDQWIWLQISNSLWDEHIAGSDPLGWIKIVQNILKDTVFVPGVVCLFWCGFILALWTFQRYCNKNTNFSFTKCFMLINCQNVLFLLQGWCAYSGASISGQRRRLRGLRVDHSVSGPAGEAQAKKMNKKRRRRLEYCHL